MEKEEEMVVRATVIQKFQGITYQRKRKFHDVDMKTEVCDIGDEKGEKMGPKKPRRNTKTKKIVQKRPKVIIEEEGSKTWHRSKGGKTKHPSNSNKTPPPPLRKRQPRTTTTTRKLSTRKALNLDFVCDPIIPLKIPQKRRSFRKWQLAIVPYSHNSQEDSKARSLEVGGGAIVPLEVNAGVVVGIKKKRARAKATIDDETIREWKMLTGTSSSAGDHYDYSNRVKWWEDERQLFHGRVLAFNSRMNAIQGNRQFSPWKGSVVDSVIGVFLTQNVSDVLSSSAFMTLAARFPLYSERDGKVTGGTEDSTDSLDWKAVKSTSVDKLAEAIKIRGMNNVLASRIKDFLDYLAGEHGNINLEWLKDISPQRVKEYLLRVNGLGLKSVECVRLLTLKQNTFPVDTNVARVAVRLGWVPLQPLDESLQLHLLEQYPFRESIQKFLWTRLCTLNLSTLYELHCQMITFGKIFCTKRNPNCNACPMKAECKHFASAFASSRLALPGPEEKKLVCRGASPVSCEPIIEEPRSPEAEITEHYNEVDIEDTLSWDSTIEIPLLKLNKESTIVDDVDISKALVLLTEKDAFIPMPKIKNVFRLRTEHYVYELPDSHPLLHGLYERERNDPGQYLFAIWSPGPVGTCTQTEDYVKGTLLLISSSRGIC